MIVTTPWGPVGVGICYDAYRFPELSRYYAAKGCRIYVNATARAESSGADFGNKTLEVTAVREGLFVVTANLCGRCGSNVFMGGSSIIGPSRRKSEPHYYAGLPFGASGADEAGTHLATIDLALADRALFCEDEATGGMRWRPKCYQSMLDDVLGGKAVNPSL